ncbi:hypothetical protein ACWGJT_17140 [Streptomyces xantholiticus]
MKARRSRVVPLESADPEGELRPLPATRSRAPVRFRAVLLHELGIIAGRGCSGSRRCVQVLDVRDEARLGGLAA